jgi:hypothetical protein
MLGSAVAAFLVGRFQMGVRRDGQTLRRQLISPGWIIHSQKEPFLTDVNLEPLVRRIGNQGELKVLVMPYAPAPACKSVLPRHSPALAKHVAVDFEIAEKPRSSGAKAPDFQQRPAIAGLLSRIYPALLIVGELTPRQADFFSDLILFFDGNLNTKRGSEP